MPERIPDGVDGTTVRVRVLLVEDHLDSARAFVKLLARSGYEARIAASAAEAITAALQESFDIVISDIGLPDASGYDMMRYLRDRFGLVGVALTGYAMDDTHEKSRAAGFIEQFVKPVDVENLLAALDRITAAARRRRNRPA